MATKQIGLGTIVKVDEDDSGSGFTTVTVVMDATPPKRERETVDCTSLDDTLQTYAPGIEKHSEFTFTQYWHPTDTQHASIDTLFGSKALVLWQVVYPFASSITDQFEGWVSALEPQTIKHNEHITRKVTIQRTGAITRS
jgi:predicted secreted protein